MFFFFQAEDGIRYLIVTGVQTCALPIWASAMIDQVAAPTEATTDGLPVPTAAAAATTAAGAVTRKAVRPRGWATRVPTSTAAHGSHSRTAAATWTGGLWSRRAAAKAGPAVSGN